MSCLRRKETRKIVTRLTSPAVRADKGALPVIPEPDPVFDRCGNRSPVISWGFMIRLPILATAFRQLRAKRWHLRLFALPQRDSHGLRMSAPFIPAVIQFRQGFFHCPGFSFRPLLRPLRLGTRMIFFKIERQGPSQRFTLVYIMEITIFPIIQLEPLQRFP